MIIAVGATEGSLQAIRRTQMDHIDIYEGYYGVALARVKDEVVGPTGVFTLRVKTPVGDAQRFSQRSRFSTDDITTSSPTCREWSAHLSPHPPECVRGFSCFRARLIGLSSIVRTIIAGSKPTPPLHDRNHNHLSRNPRHAPLATITNDAQTSQQWIHAICAGRRANEGRAIFVPATPPLQTRECIIDLLSMVARQIGVYGKGPAVNSRSSLSEAMQISNLTVSCSPS
ncbi:hypothetical protein BD779DRAFT_1739611 [Infundibulicybe gibba]|nr:hypothetical protein BD779DRAFT_1739611 [Infundibulicybe gibba]